MFAIFVAVAVVGIVVFLSVKEIPIKEIINLFYFPLWRISFKCQFITFLYASYFIAKMTIFLNFGTFL